MSIRKKPAVLTFAELCRLNTAPVLRADSNWVKEDGPLVAKGNVLKALGHPGAPFGSFADRKDSDADGNILKVTTAGTYLGKYGILVIKANGSYTYTLYSEAQKPAAHATVQGLSEGETLSESFKYKATDGFVTKSSLLKITIFGTDDPVTITDLTPAAQGGDAVVDEDGLPGALLDALRPGETDSTESATATGDFKISAPDGLKDLVVGGTTVIAGGIFLGPINITTPLGNTLTIVSFDPATGVVSYTYTLNAAETHPGAGEDSIFEQFAVKLTDVDGSTANASLDIRIVDDQPVIEVCQHRDNNDIAAFAVIVDDCFIPYPAFVDETDLTQDASVDFSTAFVHDYGADGPGNIDYSLDVTAPGVDSTLVDTLTGEKVLLSKDLITGEIVGKTETSGLTVFVIKVDAAGNVTLDQQRAVVHTPDGGPNDVVFLLSGLVVLTAKITDKDGDTDTAELDLGGFFQIYDDAASATDEAQQPVDEGQTITGTFDFDAGNDGGGVTAINGTTLVFGPDGFSQEIELLDGANNVVGKIKVKADGSYSFTAANPTNNPVTTSGTFTVTDGDDDTATANFSFLINDANGPTTGSASAAVDDDGLTSGNPFSTSGDLNANLGDDPADTSEATFTGTLGGSVGLDVPGVFSFEGLDGTPGTIGLENVTYHWDALSHTLTATITGGPRDGQDLFKVQITDPATGTFTLTLLRNVLHAGGPNDEEIDATAALQYSITDSDNTSVNGTLDITFDDDAPNAYTTGIDLVVLDDDDVPGANGNPGNGESFGDDLGPGLFLNMLDIGAGADGLKSFSVSGPATLGTEAVTSSSYDTATGLLTLSTARGDVLKITVIFANSTVTASAFTLLKPILHAAGNGENDASVTISFTLTDNDDDTATGSFSILIDDDTPIGNEITATPVLDDDVQTVFPGNTGGDSDVSDAFQATGGAGTLFSAGADGLKSLTFTDPVLSSIYKDANGLAQQEAVTFTTSFDSNTGVTTYTGSSAHNPKVIEIIANADGSYTVTQYAPIVHPTAGTSEETTDIVFNFTVTDKDDDQATGSLTVKVNDDTPVAPVLSLSTLPPVSHDESAGLDADAQDKGAAALVSFNGANVEIQTLFSAITGGDDPDVAGTGPIGYAYGSLPINAPTLLFGADGRNVTGGAIYALDIPDIQGGVPSGVSTTAGTPILLFELADGTVVGRVGAPLAAGETAATDDIAFALRVDPVTGNLAIAQYLSLQHPTPGASHDEPIPLGSGVLKLTLTIKDGDGDTATGTIDIGPKVTFQDSGPTASITLNLVSVTTDETKGDDADANDILGTSNTPIPPEFMSLGTPIEIARNASALVTASGTYGSDGPGSTVVGLDVSSTGVDSGLDTIGGRGIFLFKEGSIIVGRLETSVGSGPNPAGTVALAISISNAGVVTVAQYVPIKHDDKGDFDEANDNGTNTNDALPDDTPEPIQQTIANGALLATVTVTDGDSDTATSSIAIGNRIVFQDDGPVSITPEPEQITNAANQSETNKLDDDGNIDDDYGADRPGNIAFANITNGQQATGVINGQTVNLMSGGKLIKLYLVDHDATASTPLQLQGWTDFGLGTAQKIFTVTLNPDNSLGLSNDTYTVTILKPIDNGAGVVFSSLSGTGAAGNPTFKVIESSSADNVELLVTPGDVSDNSDLFGATVNSDADDMGIGTGQTIAPSDPLLRIDYGSFSISGNQFVVDDQSGFVNGARFKLVNVVPGAPATKVDIVLKTFDSNGDSNLTNDAADTISQVRIFATDGTTVLADRLIGEGDGNEGGFTFDFQADGSVKIVGLSQGLSVAVNTLTGFDRLEIDNVTVADNKFSVGGLSVETTNQGSPIDLTYDLALTDGDGDSLTILGAIDINVQPLPIV